MFHNLWHIRLIVFSVYLEMIQFSSLKLKDARVDGGAKCRCQCVYAVCVFVCVLARARVCVHGCTCLCACVRECMY